MAATHHAPPHVRKYYPNAVRSAWFVESFIWFARTTLGKTEEQIAFLLSICSDDLNSVQLPETRMIGPFALGGLDGYPFVGKTGIGAFSHHVPEHGVALLYFGPHIGITDTEQVGLVVRPGQNKPSACCGAAQKALQELEAGSIVPKTVSEYDIDDFQQESLRQVVLAHEREIIDAGAEGGPERFLAMTNVLYRVTRDAMQQLLSTVAFQEPAFAYGGVLINEDGGEHSDIDLRDVLLIENRQVKNLTDSYRKSTAERFQALDRGNLDAFK